MSLHGKFSKSYGFGVKKYIILSHLIEALHDHNIGVYGASFDDDLLMMENISTNFIASTICRFKQKIS